MVKHLATVITFALFAIQAAPALADKYADTVKVCEQAGGSGKFVKSAYGYAALRSADALTRWRCLIWLDLGS